MTTMPTAANLLDDAIAREEAEDAIAREQAAAKAKQIEEWAREDMGLNAYRETVRMHLREVLPILMQNRRKFSPLVEHWLVVVFGHELGITTAGSHPFEFLGPHVSEGQEP